MKYYIQLDQPRGNVFCNKGESRLPEGTPMSVPTENHSGCDSVFLLSLADHSETVLQTRAG